MRKPNPDSHGLIRLLTFAKSEAKTLTVGTFFLIIGSGMGLAYPQAIRRIIDETVSSKQLARIDRVAVWVMLIFLIQGVAAALRYYLFTVAGERIVVRLRQSLYNALLVQEIGFFDSRRTGELLSRLASDSTVLQNALSVNISMAVRNFAGGVGGLALLFYTSTKLTLVMLAVVPPVALGAGFFGRRIRNLSRQSQDVLADAGVVAEETISGIRTVRAFAQENFEMQRYGRALDRAFQVARQRIIQVAGFTGIASVLGYSAVVGVLWYGGHLVVSGRMTIGDLTSFLLYMFMVGFSLATLGSLWTDFMSATGASKRIFEILDRNPLIPISGGVRLEKIEGRVTFDEVDFSYPAREGHPVLSKISFNIRAGEVVALVGPSGSGKTTIVSLIPRFYDPQAGAILVDNQNVKALDIEWLRRHIGIVSQEPILLSDTIAENIRYGRMGASDAEVRAAAVSANAHDFISLFPEGYQTLVGEKGIQLSGGQKQRVAIARAVLKDPRILILDEATSALDSESEHLVKEALDRLMKGRTTLVIAHRLSTVRHADEVLVIENGKIVQQGSHDLLMKDAAGLYHKLVDRQFIAR